MVYLPKEIINLILSYRDPHPLSKYVNNYNQMYKNDDNFLSFKEYINSIKSIFNKEYDHSFYCYINFNVKMNCKRSKDILICCDCNVEIQLNERFFTTGDITCYKCFYHNFLK